ncbi:F-box/kelch-repeat protein At5g26960 [Mercurialis annua]|uniref:F-box/kelch-repeat protein At5g26960 n=1 Tax=Mercurialis annua TaxID=3986 RepID=UPI002160F923|nr:F-box/kelch-repeat protein At5g26960 [Mercurialis annua]
MSESCNSRHFSWLIKSCLPNPHDTPTYLSPNPIHTLTTASAATSTATTLSSLPDDLLLECLSRVSSSSLPPISAVCRRWSSLLRSPSFLLLRRSHNLLHPTIFAFSSSSSTLFAASLRFQENSWKFTTCLPIRFIELNNNNNIVHARMCAVGSRIFIICRNGLFFCYDTWSCKLSDKSPITYPRKKFATATFAGKIYVAGGGSPGGTAVEEYDPDSDTWRVVTHAPRKRFGCIGAVSDGVFYIIGGLKIGNGNEFSRAGNVGGEAAHVYASSMDLYDVEASVWLRSRAIPGGGCVVAACEAAGYVYILASHAVELSFWRFEARRRVNGGKGFGEWSRIKSPPLPAQVRLDSTVRFSFVGVENKVVLIQVAGCIDDLLRRSGRNVRGLREGLVLVYDCGGGEWSRGPDLPEVIRRAACVAVEC